MISTDNRAKGFTLVELLVAVGLLALLIVMAGYIFSTSINAISTAQGSSELLASLSAFAERMRADLEGIEHDGFLSFGAREQEGYGTLADRTGELEKTYRNDWITFFSISEHSSMVDARAIGVWSRIIYGHGRVSDERRTDYHKDLGTDWSLLRHEVLEIAVPVISYSTVETVHVQGATPAALQGVEHPGYDAQRTSGGDTRAFQTAIEAYARRSYNWYWWARYNFTTMSGGEVIGVGFDEPWFYFDYNEDLTNASFLPHSPSTAGSPGNYYEHSNSAIFGNSPSGRRFHALPHCADFRIQYAMAADVNNGQVTWHDPPLRGDGAGAMRFRPGDEWPVMLKISVLAFDPMDRLKGGRRLELVVRVP